MPRYRASAVPGMPDRKAKKNKEVLRVGCAPVRRVRTACAVHRFARFQRNLALRLRHPGCLHTSTCRSTRTSSGACKKQTVDGARIELAASALRTSPGAGLISLGRNAVRPARRRNRSDARHCVLPRFSAESCKAVGHKLATTESPYVAARRSCDRVRGQGQAFPTSFSREATKARTWSRGESTSSLLGSLKSP